MRLPKVPKKTAPEKIGSILDSVLTERGYLTICKEWDAVAKWKEIAGPRLGEVTECERVENGILFVRVSSSAWRQEIVYLKKELLDKIKDITGCATIRDIVFR